VPGRMRGGHGVVRWRNTKSRELCFYIPTTYS
jgi:hypothetical protein